ncbi:MAG: glycosyltransferase [Oscillospiraceae bacterium]|nr:glycosyltransferase [Oscillospiraceae bacterium]
MSEIYGKSYYDNYDVGIGSVNYLDSQYTKGFLTQLAKRIADDLHPKTVLDAGCAMGHLVAALRDNGVEAYGIDISEYAISMVREDIRPYCAVCSLTGQYPESFPEKFDLVVTIEVLEHLYSDEGKKAIEQLCKRSDTILFSSTPDDFSDPTHVNVQQREYWARLFAENGFYDDINYRPTYLTFYATLFKRGDNIVRQIEDYERNIRISEAKSLREAEEFRKAIDDKEVHIQNLSSMLEDIKKNISKLDDEVKEKNQELDAKSVSLEKAAMHTLELEKTVKEQMQLLQSQNKVLDEAKEQFVELGKVIDIKKHQIEKQGIMLGDANNKAMKLEKTIAEKDQSIDGLNNELKALSEEKAATEQELSHYKEHYTAAINQREELKRQNASLGRQLAEAQNAYAVISNAASWKMTKPIRALLDLLKRIPLFALMVKGLKCLKDNGWSYTWRKIKYKLKHRNEYVSLAAMPLYSKEELEKQRSEVFNKKVKFSIVVPLYNTPEKFLREMIQSVQDQTYADWELCMADGSDNEHKDVGRICKSYAKNDSRIKYKKLKKNLGISGNTNACLDMATGDYIALFDHDDLLHPAALHDVMQVICDKDADFIYTDENTFHHTPEDAFCPHFKPDFAPDSLRGLNYICHLTVFKASLLEKAGRFRPECDGSQDYDMVLRLTEQAKHIVHIPKILYYWRAHPNSVAESVGAKPYVIEAAHKALSDHLKRVGLEGEVEDTRVPTVYKINYKIKGTPLVSILIPNYEYKSVLETCLNSIYEKTTYPNFEVIVIENNSKSKEIFSYYKEIQRKWKNLRVVKWEKHFNYSAINNFGAKYANGEHLLLLNNDIEVISPDWIQEMLMFSQRSDVGAVGAMLYYPDDTIQHAGVILGIGGVAGHSHKYFKRGDYGYMSRLCYAQNLSCVTAACVMIRKDVWEAVNGLDESFEVAFNDVDLCMRIRKAGYLVVWTPFAELYHYESKSRGIEDTPEKQKRFSGEVIRFQKRWSKELQKGDPYYNPNFTLDREDFSLR